jgi:hypothetical protein
MSPLMAQSGHSNRTRACPLLDQSGQRWLLAHDGLSAFDPTATLAVHCGNGFDAGFNPYQSTRLNRYDAPPELEGGHEAARTPRGPHTGNMPMRVWGLRDTDARPS